MSRVKLIITVAFVLAMGAGVAVGVLTARIPERHEPRSWLADELNLDTMQRDQMKSIWQDVSKNRQHDWESRRALDKDRNDKIVALFSPQQKAQFDAINQQYQQKQQELAKQREKAFQDAVEATKQILTPDQRVKYEAMMQKRRDDHGPGGSRHGGPGGPTTEPSARLTDFH